VYTNVLKLDWVKEAMRDKIEVKFNDFSLNCKFVRNFEGLYGCEIENLVIDTPEYRVAHIHGAHADGNTNLEVEYVWIKNSQTTYLPHFDAQVFFPNLLKYLITDSHLKVVERDNFAGMPKLETLNMDNNDLTSFPEDLVYDLGNLVDLFFDANKVKALPTYLLNNAPMFQRFKAVNNSIEAIDADFFKRNHNLKIVSLDNNKLRNIRVDFLPYKNIRKLDFLNNPCINTSFNDWRKKNSIQHVQDEINRNCR